MRASRKGLSTSEVSPSPPLVPQPLVAVTMGSDSDLPVLKPCLALLTTFGIPFYQTITSAHRTPLRMTEFASTAAAKGFKVIIAAAGGAAHLPGMIAASTTLPVIGVPVKGSTLEGMDSLLSIVQMPRGVPVATVQINNGVSFSLSRNSRDDAVALRIASRIPQLSLNVPEYPVQSNDLQAFALESNCMKVNGGIQSEAF